MAQAVPGGEAHRTKMSDVHAGHAPEGLLDPTDPWGTLGVHVVATKGAHAARVGGGVSVVSLSYVMSPFRQPSRRAARGSYCM